MTIRKRLVSVFICTLYTLYPTAYAQNSSFTVRYQVTYDTISRLYTAWVVPQYTVPNSNNTGTVERGGTAQFTLVVPKDFVISNITDVNGTWTKETDPSFLKFGPGQPNQTWTGLNPNLNYYVIGKAPTETNYGSFTAGTAVRLFTFRGNGCFGTVAPLPFNDPFAVAADRTYSLNVNCSFYSRSGQPLGGNQIPLEQFAGVFGSAANCYFSKLSAQADSASTASNVLKNIQVLANDKNGAGGFADVRTVSPPSVSTPPSNGTTVVKPDGSIDYVPRSGFVGVDSFRYRICDSSDLTVCATAVVTVRVVGAASPCATDTLPPTIVLTHPLLTAIRPNDTLVFSCVNPPIFGVNDARVSDNRDPQPRLFFEDLAKRIGVCAVDGYRVLMGCRWRAVDTCGNVAIFPFFVKITDNTPPQLRNAPSNVTINANLGETPPSVPTLVATDNCGNARVVFRQDTLTIANSCNFILQRTWTSTDECGNTSVHTQGISVQKTCPPRAPTPPTARPDSVRLAKNKTLFVDVTLNDSLNGSVLRGVVLTQLPTHGNASVVQGGQVVYLPNANFCSKDSLSYRVCTDGGCANAALQISMICQDLKVFSGFSPNNDGINDHLIIEAIENYPKNTVQIFNAFGQMVFESKGYKNDWDGKKDGQNLPIGTYYYLLNDGLGHQLTGYFFLNY